jgi:hypothetical protein
MEMASTKSSGTTSVLGKSAPETISKQSANETPGLSSAKALSLKSRIQAAHRKYDPEKRSEQVSKSELIKQSTPSVAGSHISSVWNTVPNKPLVTRTSESQRKGSTIVLPNQPVQRAIANPNAHLRNPNPTVCNSVYNQRQRNSLYSQQTISGTGRSTDTLHRPEEFFIGTIFSTPSHEQHWNQVQASTTDSNISLTRYGKIVSKLRKYIVISRFGNKVIALPVFTHGGKGLQYKQAVKNQYVSIRDESLKQEAAAAESDHGLLWAITYPQFECRAPFHKMNDYCCVELIAPTTIKTDLPCTIHGILQPKSLEKLQNLHRDAMQGKFS